MDLYHLMYASQKTYIPSNKKIQQSGHEKPVFWVVVQGRRRVSQNNIDCYYCPLLPL